MKPTRESNLMRAFKLAIKTLKEIEEATATGKLGPEGVNRLVAGRLYEIGEIVR